ncbi:hypothetical protein CRE_10682 [Caenorhabditis remanei]|uniref:DDE Tnp4 domain-containing protein n=1 Tax=Caenorhabditis remanei TaxID=31234 RepID=E3NIL5_CAERE|nr:hypothetical protein CRE_10682 [Caenorhabditis remanei]
MKQVMDDSKGKKCETEDICSMFAQKTAHWPEMDRILAKAKVVSFIGSLKLPGPEAIPSNYGQMNYERRQMDVVALFLSLFCYSCCCYKTVEKDKRNLYTLLTVGSNIISLQPSKKSILSMGLSQPTLSRLISSCIHDICKEAPKYIKFPKTKAEIQTMTRAFADKTYSNGTVKVVALFLSLFCYSCCCYKTVEKDKRNLYTLLTVGSNIISLQPSKKSILSMGLSQPTLSRLISSCIHDICKEAPKYIKFPKTKAEIQTMTRAFADKTYSNGTVKGVPCFAVVDGKHWRCDHPPNTGSLNRNYKSFFSFNSLFVCDNDTRIIYAQISELGVNSDAQLFRCGILDELMERAVRTVGYQKLGDSDVIMPPFILGDNGFGLSKHVITPYRQNQLASSGHIKFNEIISGSRVKIENCFGILTSKFQIFSRNLRLDPKTSRALIVSASVIHNISLGPLEVSPENDDDDECTDPYRTPEEQRSALREYLLNR